VRSIDQQHAAESVRTQFDLVVQQVAAKFPKAAGILRDARDELLSPRRRRAHVDGLTYDELHGLAKQPDDVDPLAVRGCVAEAEPRSSIEDVKK
jgi:hypothetical protein